MTQFITVRSVALSRAFYSEVLGGQVMLEENPCIVKLANSWVLTNRGGPPPPTSLTSRSLTVTTGSGTPGVPPGFLPGATGKRGDHAP